MDPTRPKRVLLRPPPSSSSPNPSPPPPPPHSPSPSPPPSSSSSGSGGGVVVVGFVGRRRADVAQLLNRVIDSNVFGNRDKPVINVREEEEGDERGWRSRVRYYHDEEKGIVYVGMWGTRCPVADDEGVEEAEEMKGLLLLLTVCHVIVYIQEGSRFHVELLRKLRVLQSAKNALVPWVRCRNQQPSASAPPSAPSISSTRISSKSLGRGTSYQNRHNSSVSDMSSIGSYASLFPGQCTPVVLFTFIDDFTEMVASTASAEESKDASSSNQISSLSSLARPGSHVKGSGSVVVLARPANKFDSGPRRKLQSSLESQIRFLIKKCRTLSSSEISHTGSRNRTFPSSLPLLTLDASRAVVLVESCTNRVGEALRFATSLAIDVLTGKATPESLLIESHARHGSKEDVGSLKDFIFRQADILRGKGGITNANSGSAAGVGMVAVAAAAAAASAASRRLRSVPELPSLRIWLSNTQDILKGLLSAQHVHIDNTDISRRKFHQRNGFAPPVDGADPLDVAASLLAVGKGMNSNFSTSWCQRAYPAGLEVYLKDLPGYYPTLQHEAHLEKALQAYNSMVKGPSVNEFTKKLEDECTLIWESGRQSCDAVSLTGRSCVYPRHNAQDDSDATGRPHSSELVFLHACACGRSRRPRPDPFDFKSANVTFNCSSECDKAIPVVQLPKASDDGSVELFPWHIVRVGDSRYYDPSKGLPQSGFSTNQKFLMKWASNIEKDKVPNISYANAVKQGSLSSSADTNCESRLDANTWKDVPPKAHLEVDTRVESQRSTVEQSNDGRISFGKGLPNIIMKKPFAEVVAGTASTTSAFPPLQVKKPPAVIPERGPKKSSGKDGSPELADIALTHQKSVQAATGGSSNVISSIENSDRSPFLQIGSNVVPLNANGIRNTRPNLSSDQVLVYVGFEHECPRGHRFLLSPVLLDELESSYSSAGENNVLSSAEHAHYRHRDYPKLAMSGLYDKLHLARNDSPDAIHGGRNLLASGDMHSNNDLSMNGQLYLSEPGKEHYYASSDASLMSDSRKDLLGQKDLHDGGHATSLLNRDLPIYMNCPQCRIYKNKKDKRTPKFAGTISQLQRIFVVTPPLPVELATDAVVLFEASCQPFNYSNGEQLRFSPGCQVILPPDSFVSIRLPFIYGVQVETGLHPLKPFDRHPEVTAWIQAGTTLRLISKGSLAE
ncbi:hypothetical protein Droror1_Dr00017343 [Drosera rotundifolia]